MTKRRIIVVGGGPAGLMAAGMAALNGAETTLLEKMERPGRKLRISGKGRCNLTNIDPLPDFIDHFGAGGKFLRPAFSRFFSNDLISFLEELGVPTVAERGGRVFPASGRAQDVVDALVRWARKCGVKIHAKTPVKSLIIEEGRIIGVEKTSERLSSDAVIVATGGASYPATGSTGDGYLMAAAAGHAIIPIRPSLVPIETAGFVASRLDGLSLRNVAARLLIDGKKRAEEFGEMEFTSFGISGPIILSLSRRIVDALRLGNTVAVSIDLKPALDNQKLEARLLRDFSKFGKRPFRELLRELLPPQMIPVCVDQTNIAPEKSASQISAVERGRLRAWLKNFRLDVTGHRPFEEAIITAGGIDTRSIDPNTMASRIVENLYFAGELLDVDADTGGYNLQAAFSMGRLAGVAAAK